MSKRKSSVDLRRGFNAPGRRSSVINLQARAMSIVHRKPGATNVRSTSSHKVIVRSDADTQRNSPNVSGTCKISSVTRHEETKIPKTRFDLANGRNTHTTRLKNFPVESVRKTVVSWPYSPSSIRNIADQEMCERVGHLTTNTNADTLTKDLPSHGYGDTLKLCPTDRMISSPQPNEQRQQNPKQAITLGQPHMSTEQYVGRVNQSEAMLNGRVPSPPRPPIHRPFVPNVVQGTVVRKLSPDKSVISPHVPAQQSYALCATPHSEQQREQVSSTAVEQSDRPPVPVCQQVSQISQTPVSDQPSRAVPLRLRRNIIPWKLDDCPTVCDYEIQPVGGKNATAQDVGSGLGEKSDTQRQAVATGQPTTAAQESCRPSSIQHWGSNQQQQQPHQEQFHQYQQQQQQQQYQYLNRQGSGTTQTLQNAQQMYHQLQNNTIRQQEMQQRALRQQQQMMMMTQQHEMRPRPLDPCQLKMAVHQAENIREPCINSYLPQQIYGGRFPISTQDNQADKITIPHHQMLMQHRNSENRSSQINPQHDWVGNNRQVIGDHTTIIKGHLKPFTVNLVSSGGQPMASIDVNRYDQLKGNAAPVTANLHLAQHQTGTECQQGMPYPQYTAAMHQYPLIQHMQERPSPVSSRQYLSVQQKGQVSTTKPQLIPMIHRHRYQHPQQPHAVKKFDSPGVQRQAQSAKKKYPMFTTEMIRDQELLVANMRQQKIPEDIMRRQFDALLSEQRRNLEVLGEHDPTDKINDISLRRDSRFLYEDQRPEWMGRITPARVTIQPAHNLRDSLNQRDTKYLDQERRQSVPEQMRQYDQRQQEISHNIIDPQYSKIPPYQSDNPNHGNMHHSLKQHANNQQSLNDLPAPSPYTSASMPRMLSSPGSTYRWSQQNYDSQSDPQRHSVPSNYFQTECQQRPAIRYELVPNKSQEINQPQQLQAINCQKTQQVENITTEQHQQRQKLMVQEFKGQYCIDSNSCQDERGNIIKPDEPSSLLKLREFQQYIRPQRQNNGLQAAETIRTAMEALNGPNVDKGLKYVTELGKKITHLRLNGTQDPSELEKISPPPLGYLQRMEQRKQPVSSNGLCNARNANNPVSPPRSFPQKINQSPMVGYPRQYYPGEKPQMNVVQGVHKIMAEKENGSVAGATQQNHPGTVFLQGYGLQAMEPYSSIRATAESQYLLQQDLDQIDDRCKRSKIPCELKNPIRPQGTASVSPYKFEESEPLYQQQIKQFYRNQMELKNLSERESSIAALEQGPHTANETFLAPQILHNSVDNDVRAKAFDAHPNTPPHRIDPQGPSQIREMIAASQQSANHLYNSYDPTRTVENKKAYTVQCPRMQQAIGDSSHGQPEIRERRTIGGLMYLARKVDYIQHPPLIAPHALIASKFLQPSVSFN